jgi:hypothetical protein
LCASVGIIKSALILLKKSALILLIHGANRKKILYVRILEYLIREGLYM